MIYTFFKSVIEFIWPPKKVVPEVKQKGIKIIPPHGQSAFQFGQTFVIAKNMREARRIMGREYEEFLKEKQRERKEAK